MPIGSHQSVKPRPAWFFKVNLPKTEDSTPREQLTVNRENPPDIVKCRRYKTRIVIADLNTCKCRGFSTGSTFVDTLIRNAILYTTYTIANLFRFLSQFLPTLFLLGGIYSLELNCRLLQQHNLLYCQVLARAHLNKIDTGCCVLAIPLYFMASGG